MTKLASTTAIAAFLFASPAFAQTAPASSAPASANIQYMTTQSEDQWLASTFMGETVRGANDEHIGEINNLVLDKSGKIVAAVIGVGGFLGIGEKDVAVPFETLKISNERDEVITLSATEEQLRNAPEFKDLDDVASSRNDMATPTGMPATNNVPARPVPPAPGTPAVSTPVQ